MSYCTKCNKDFDSDLSSCPRCGSGQKAVPENTEKIKNEAWVVIGHVRDQTTADYARETMESYDIPCVVISESGFFGQAGLNLPSLAGSHVGAFKIQVPAELAKDAVNVMNMILGDSWEKDVDIQADE